MTRKCQKDPNFDSFVHFESYGGVPKMLNIYILITWTLCKVAGLRLLSTGLHPPFPDLNMPERELKMIIFADTLLFCPEHKRLMDGFSFFIIPSRLGKPAWACSALRMGSPALHTRYLCVYGFGLVA